MSSVNKAIIMGALGRDPEIRTMTSGDKIANMSIATSERWTDKRSGEKQEKTEWHRVSVFNQHIVRVIESQLKKGAQVYIEGEVRTRKWKDREGVERFTTEIVLPGFGGELKIVQWAKGDRADAGASSGGPARQPDRTDPKGNPQWSALDDEIPF